MIVLDASALLALLLREPGHQRVAHLLPDACMSSVNLCEVLTRFARANKDVMPLAERLLATPLEVVPFSAEQAAIAAALTPLLLPLGLSLGDRACLALARQRGLPILTADRAWRRLPAAFEVELLR